MREPVKIEASPRLLELDGLRGLAAFSVMLGHIVGMLPETPFVLALQASPLRVIWGGTAAVYLFFVLSGFVLALPFANGSSRLSYAKFMILRVFRIYPAYLTALAVSVLAIGLYHPATMAGLSDWARSFWDNGIPHLTTSQIVRHILLVPGFDTHLLDPPMWTLVIEMRMSAVIPLFIVAFMYSRSVLATAAIFAASCALAFIDALYWLPMFVAGIVLAQHRDAVLRWARRRPSAVAWTLACLGLALYGNEYVLQLGQPRSVMPWLAVGGSLLLILFASTLPALGRILRTQAVQFLGRVSYSLYLLHFPILFLAVSRFSQFIGFWGSVAVAIPCTLGLSWLCYTRIELPMMRLGRRVASPFPRFEARLLSIASTAR